jgi:8-oxo-dGTP pyrophosphatase MutT (NUDIX family)
MPHIHEKIDYVAETYIVNGDAVLLRVHDKYKVWLAPGGHVELHEDPAEAALREVKEEVGMDVTLLGEPEVVPLRKGASKNLLLPRFMDRHRVNDTHEHIALIYFATSKDRNFSQGETEKSDAIRWFTKEELKDPANNVSEMVQYHALAALEAAAKVSTK